MTDSTTRRGRADAGVTLVEVVAAMLVFGIIASGIIAGISIVSRMSADNRAREVATGLATADLDVVRGIADPFHVVGVAPYTRVVGGRTYTVKRTMSWVGPAGGDIGCDSDANISYKRVTASVTWDGMLATTAPVRSDILLAPLGPVSDPSLGTLIVKAEGLSGSHAGVTVSVAPVSGSGAGPLTAAPAPTDDDGCTYVRDVKPGVYTVSLWRSKWISGSDQDPAMHQVDRPTRTVNVVASGTTPATFVYDPAATVALTYGGNYTARTPILPENITATLQNLRGNVVPSAAGPTALAVYPYADGYTAVAGAVKRDDDSCAAVVPGNWLAGSVDGTRVQQGVTAGVTTAPGGVSAVSAPMGVVWVRGSGVGYLTAVSADPVPDSGNPGCRFSTTYRFGQVAKAGWVPIALPFGAWRLYTAAAAGVTTDRVTKTNLYAVTNAVPAAAVTSGDVVTLDPRSRQ